MNLDKCVSIKYKFKRQTNKEKFRIFDDGDDSKEKKKHSDCWNLLLKQQQQQLVFMQIV